MAADLLHYFDRELAFLRDMGAEFAAAHPKIAGRLRLSKDSIDDPHVARLIQSVAFLNARTRQKIEEVCNVHVHDCRVRTALELYGRS